MVALLGVGLTLALALPWPLGLVFGGVFGFIAPQYQLKRIVGARQKEITLALPNALDLLCISVEAGLGFDAALARVVEKFDNALSREFAFVLNEIRLGRPRHEALEDLGKRSGVPELNSFIQALVQSDQLGVGIARVLRIQSDEMRRRRRQRAEAKAQQASLKMLFPSVAVRSESGSLVAGNVTVADGFGTRLIGLMGRTRLDPDEGLWLLPCNGVHMFFMRTPLDIAYLDRQHRVVLCVPEMREWRVKLLPVRRAHSALEHRDGTGGSGGAPAPCRRRPAGRTQPQSQGVVNESRGQ